MRVPWLWGCCVRAWRGFLWGCRQWWCQVTCGLVCCSLSPLPLATPQTGGKIITEKTKKTSILAWCSLLCAKKRLMRNPSLRTLLKWSLPKNSSCTVKKKFIGAHIYSIKLFTNTPYGNCHEISCIYLSLAEKGLCSGKEGRGWGWDNSQCRRQAANSSCWVAEEGVVEKARYEVGGEERGVEGNGWSQVRQSLLVAGARWITTTCSNTLLQQANENVKYA